VHADEPGRAGDQNSLAHIQLLRRRSGAGGLCLAYL
jgi:hypothetical protein